MDEMERRESFNSPRPSMMGNSPRASFLDGDGLSEEDRIKLAKMRRKRLLARRANRKKLDQEHYQRLALRSGTTSYYNSQAHSGFHSPTHNKGGQRSNGNHLDLPATTLTNRHHQQRYPHHLGAGQVSVSRPHSTDHSAHSPSQSRLMTRAPTTSSLPGQTRSGGVFNNDIADAAGAGAGAGAGGMGQIGHGSLDETKLRQVTVQSEFCQKVSDPNLGLGYCIDNICDNKNKSNNKDGYLKQATGPGKADDSKHTGRLLGSNRPVSSDDFNIAIDKIGGSHSHQKTNKITRRGPPVPNIVRGETNEGEVRMNKIQITSPTDDGRFYQGVNTRNMDNELEARVYGNVSVQGGGVWIFEVKVRSLLSDFMVGWGTKHFITESTEGGGWDAIEACMLGSYNFQLTCHQFSDLQFQKKRSPFGVAPNRGIQQNDVLTCILYLDEQVPGPRVEITINGLPYLKVNIPPALTDCEWIPVATLGLQSRLVFYWHPELLRYVSPTLRARLSKPALEYSYSEIVGLLTKWIDLTPEEMETKREHVTNNLTTVFHFLDEDSSSTLDYDELLTGLEFLLTVEDEELDVKQEALALLGYRAAEDDHDVMGILNEKRQEELEILSWDNLNRIARPYFQRIFGQTSQLQQQAKYHPKRRDFLPSRQEFAALAKYSTETEVPFILREEFSSFYRHIVHRHFTNKMKIKGVSQAFRSRKNSSASSHGISANQPNTENADNKDNTDQKKNKADGNMAGNAGDHDNGGLIPEDELQQISMEAEDLIDVVDNPLVRLDEFCRRFEYQDYTKDAYDDYCLARLCTCCGRASCCSCCGQVQASCNRFFYSLFKWCGSMLWAAFFPVFAFYPFFKMIWLSELKASNRVILTIALFGLFSLVCFLYASPTYGMYSYIYYYNDSNTDWTGEIILLEPLVPFLLFFMIVYMIGSFHYDATSELARANASQGYFHGQHMDDEKERIFRAKLAVNRLAVRRFDCPRLDRIPIDAVRMELTPPPAKTTCGTEFIKYGLAAIFSLTHCLIPGIVRLFEDKAFMGDIKAEHLVVVQSMLTAFPLVFSLLAWLFVRMYEFQNDIILSLKNVAACTIAAEAREAKLDLYIDVADQGNTHNWLFLRKSVIKLVTHLADRTSKMVAPVILLDIILVIIVFYHIIIKDNRQLDAYNVLGIFDVGMLTFYVLNLLLVMAAANTTIEEHQGVLQARQYRLANEVVDTENDPVRQQYKAHLLTLLEKADIELANHLGAVRIFGFKLTLGMVNSILASVVTAGAASAISVLQEFLNI